MDQQRAEQIARSRQAEGTLDGAERRIIELVDGERRVRDVRVWLVYFVLGRGHVEIAVDEASGEVVRRQRSR